MLFKNGERKKHASLLVGFLFLLFVLALFLFPRFGVSVVWNNTEGDVIASTTSEFILPPPVAHIATPEHVRALYMSGCVAGVPSLRNKLLALATSTEVNAFVIDIKDYSGAISIQRENPIFNGNGKLSCGVVPDMQEFVKTLHDNDIYVIGRVTVFQDPQYAQSHPELAVQRKDGSVWKDRKGLAFIDVSSRKYWDEIIHLSKDAYAMGFDEINFDYIRFPSDGDMSNIMYVQTGTTTKPVALKNFFSYLHESLRGSGIVTSADLFGMTTSNTDDLGIGQVLEDALPYFDFIAPMVYPSHYPPGFMGYKNPAAVPYEIISYAMGRGLERTIAASSSPSKLRAWLQDFDMGAVYTADLVRAQKKALYDLGLTSWMMWDPSNTYTRAALDTTP